MKLKDEKVSKKSKEAASSIMMYVAASIVSLVGIALLANNIILFRNTVAQYVAQGYDKTMVTSQLIPSQLLPGICEPVAIYGGIAFALVGVGIINGKASKCLILLSEVKDRDNISNDAIEQSILEENVVEAENTETMEQEGIVEEIKEETKQEVIEAGI